MISNARAEIAQQLFSFLSQKNITYCLVGDTRDYPEKIASDIDIVVDNLNVKKIILLLKQFCAENDCALVQILQHEQTAWYFVLAKIKDGQFIFIQPDICTDYYRNGILFLSCDELISQAAAARSSNRNIKGFNILKPNKEFIYYLLKKVDKTTIITETQFEHLRLQWLADADGCQKELPRFWEETEVNQLNNIFRENNIHQLNELLLILNKKLHLKLNGTLTAKFREFNRVIARLCNPTGLFVVFLGADGSGKSSVIEQITKQLAPAFRNTQYIHLRPHLGKSKAANNIIVTNPHGQPLRNSFSSSSKIFYFLFDYTIGYIVKIYPMLVRSTLIVFDRYYYDLLIDPKRYRYGGSLKFAAWVAKLIPKPDLVVLLDAPTEVLQARKQEVSFLETARQREAYLKLVNSMNNGVVIDASQPLESVVNDACRKIIKFMENRVKQRYET